MITGCVFVILTSIQVHVSFTCYSQMCRYVGFSDAVHSAGRGHVCFYVITFVFLLYYKEMLRVAVVTASCVVKGVTAVVFI